MAQPSNTAKTGLDRSLVAVEVLAGVAVVAAVIGRAYGPAPTVIFIIGGGAVAFTVYVGLKMLSALRDPSLDVTGRIEDDDRNALEHEKTLILLGIKELEADAGVGKVDPKDYDFLRSRAEADAVRIIQLLKEDDAKWRAEAEQLVSQRLGRSIGPASPAKTPETAADPIARALFDDRPVRFDAVDDAQRCSGCSTTNDDDARFCVGCGRPRQTAVEAAS